MTQIHDDGRIEIDGNIIGKLKGLTVEYTIDNTDLNDELKNSLITELEKRADKLIESGDAALRFSDDYHILWNWQPVAKIIKSDDILTPSLELILDNNLQGFVLARVGLHIESWFKRQIKLPLEALINLKETTNLQGNALELAQKIVGNFGYIERNKVTNILKNLTPEEKNALREKNIRFAQYGIFVRDIIKPAAISIKLVLWSLKNNLPTIPEKPPAGLVTIPYDSEKPTYYYEICGFKILGGLAVRVDMVERLVDAIRPLTEKSDSNPNGAFKVTPQLMSFVGRSGEEFEKILKDLGYNYRTEMIEKTIEQKPITPKVENTTVENTDTHLSEEASEKKEEPQENIVEHNIETTAIELSLESTSDNNEVASEKVMVEEKIWFRFIKKPQPHKNKDYKPYHKHDDANEKNTHSSSKKEHFKKDFFADGAKHKGKPYNKDAKKDFSHKDKHHKPHSKEFPKKKKEIDPDNPFAALLALKNKM